MELARRFDGLPLALATAGAYLRSTTHTFKKYLGLYETRWRELGKVAGRMPLGEYDRTLYTTWDLTLDRLQNGEPHAADFLRLLTNFDKGGISHTFLQCGLTGKSFSGHIDKLSTTTVKSVHHGKETAQNTGKHRAGPDEHYSCPPWVVELMQDEIRFDSLVGRLRIFSLLERNPQFQTFGMHACVSDWVFNALNQPPDPLSYQTTVRCIVQASRLRLKQQSSANPKHSGYHIEDRDLKRHARALLDRRFQHLLVDSVCDATFSTELSMLSDIWAYMDPGVVSEARLICWKAYTNAERLSEDIKSSWKLLALCLRIYISLRVQAVEDHVKHICEDEHFLPALEQDSGPESITLAWCLGQCCGERRNFAYAERLYNIGLCKGADREGVYNVAGISSIVSLYHEQGKKGKSTLCSGSSPNVQKTLRRNIMCGLR